jgi:hypothetical protein
MFRISTGSAAESQRPDTEPVAEDKDREVDDDWGDPGRVSKTLTVISVKTVLAVGGSRLRRRYILYACEK